MKILQSVYCKILAQLRSINQTMPFSPEIIVNTDSKGKPTDYSRVTLRWKNTDDASCMEFIAWETLVGIDSCIQVRGEEKRYDKVIAEGISEKGLEKRDFEEAFALLITGENL